MNTNWLTKCLLFIAVFLFTISIISFSPKDCFCTEPHDTLLELYGADPDEVMGNNASLKIVRVSYDGDVQWIFSRSYSPVTALIDAGFSVSNRNRVVSTSPISSLFNHSHILVETYRTTIDEILLDIPYSTVVSGNSLCRKLSKETVEQFGVLGVMSKKIKKIYRGNKLIAEEVIEETVEREARPEIIVIKGPDDTPDSVPQRGYNCDYWHSYVDSISATNEEKQWLKFVMKWESGCNAENNKSFYKGLFQWDPCLWYTLYPNDNIFDGEKQVKRTLEKLRAGANPNRMWPAVHKKYKAAYGELSWLQ